MSRFFVTPEIMDRIYKKKEILKDWRLQGKKPTIYLVKLIKKTNSLVSYEIPCDWSVKKISNWKNFKENWVSSNCERYLTISIPLKWDYENNVRLDVSTIFPSDLGDVPSNSYRCFDLSKEDALKSLQKSFSDRLDGINERMDKLKKSKKILEQQQIMINKALDKNFEEKI